MANRLFNKPKPPTAEKSKSGPSTRPMPETPNKWPGLPGPASESRGDGTPKHKQYPVSEGM